MKKEIICRKCDCSFAVRMRSRRKTDNISVGMTALENLQYEEAIGCFEAALENQENERQLYRGMGIAYSLTQ